MLFLFFVYQELQEFYPGDNVFDATDWPSLSEGFDRRWKKKVNLKCYFSKLVSLYLEKTV